MNVNGLFAALRALDPNGKLSQPQVDSVNAILEACNKYSITDLHRISYIIATAYHEARLKPVEEIGKGAGHDYGKKLDIGQGSGHRVPYTEPDKLFYGRGLVQITWLSNYKQFSKLLGVDLVNHPELAMQTDIASEIIVMGMKGGLFTGKSLSNYFTGITNDAINARRIINGLDAATMIAGYYNHIYAGISAT